MQCDASAETSCHNAPSLSWVECSDPYSGLIQVLVLSKLAIPKLYPPVEAVDHQKRNQLRQRLSAHLFSNSFKPVFYSPMREIER